MASDLIYREDAKDFVRHAYHKGLNPVEYLDEVPAADVRPVVRGRWEDGNKSIKNPERYAFNWWCSICGTPQHTPVAKTLAEFTTKNPYCHNCGADMRGGSEDGA